MQGERDKLFPPLIVKLYVRGEKSLGADDAAGLLGVWYVFEAWWWGEHFSALVPLYE